MKITIFLLILVAACTQTCSKGGLRSDNSDCYYPSYLEGCLTYSIDNSKNRSVQMRDLRVRLPTHQPGLRAHRSQLRHQKLQQCLSQVQGQLPTQPQWHLRCH